MKPESRVASTDNDGEAVELWAESNNLSLIHNAKLPKSFNSAIWKKGYNPDLIFASSNISNMCEKSVLDPIAHTQHRPICVSVNPVIVVQSTIFRRCFNLKKADWEGFSADLDSNIEEVDAIPENYERFVEMLRVASRKHIPRGCRSNYIPGLTDESKSLYEAYKKQYSIDPFGKMTIDTENTLIDKMKDEKKKSWEEVITSTDLKHNSRRAEQTIRKLSNDPTTPNPPCLVNAKLYLRANTDKTQVTAFHLRNKEAKRTLKVKWNRTDLENTPHPKYLGVTLNRSSATNNTSITRR